ncbi:MAG: Ig-like domain-containing protein, partial [Oscillospiraceae bacterium]|nr:Ig-like domain-containing protein [Oscillospiraceae bacterium]
LTAHVTPTNASDRRITWTVTSGNAVTVNRNTGMITGQRAGTSTVRATSVCRPNIWREVRITVVNPPPPPPSVLSTRRTTQTPSIIWNPMGGNVFPRTHTLQDGLQLSILPPPSSGNKTFRGWSTTDGTTRGQPVSPFTIIRLSAMLEQLNLDVTFYARWHDPSRHYPIRDHRTNIPYRFTGRDLWRTEMRAAAASWNNKSTPIRFSQSSVSFNTVQVLEVYPDEPRVLGQRIPGVVFGTNMRTWQIEMFETALETHARENNYNIRNVVQNVFAHELGHVIGLRDNPIRGTVNGSIMNSGNARSRNRLPGITSFDVQSVNWLY